MKKLFVLSGGVGREREVSLASGKNVAAVLRVEGVSCEEIVIEKDKSFIYEGRRMSEEEGLQLLKDSNTLVFQLVHGAYGEDGELVRKLEEVGVPCIGSSSAVLQTTIQKSETEVLLRNNGVKTTESVLVRNKEDIARAQLSFPLIVKPNTEGSSFGVVKVDTVEGLEQTVNEGLAIYGEVLVQKCINGREFTCGVIEIDGKEIALPPTEVVLTQGDLFDYKAKYSENGCLEVTPAEVDGVILRKIQDTALRVHAVCGCKDISRTDMIMDENSELVVLEINTIPGMTKTSFIPAQIKAGGYMLADFVKGMMKKYK